MTYVTYDINNNITGVFSAAQSFPTTIVTDTDPTVQAFLSAMFIPPITRRQFFQQLAAQGIIANTDAVAALSTGTIPAALQTLINGLPVSEQFQATMLVLGADSYFRKHPFTIAMGTAYGWTSTQMDTFFLTAATL